MRDHSGQTLVLGELQEHTPRHHHYVLLYFGLWSFNDCQYAAYWHLQMANRGIDCYYY